MRNMRDRMERFVLLPFAMGCISESSIAVGMENAKRPKVRSTATRPPGEDNKEKEEQEEYSDSEESLSGENMRNPSYLLAIPRLQKLFKNVKNLPQLFVYKDELEPDMGMEIGLPTDVKHVTHIGMDGCTSSILSQTWEDNRVEQNFIDLPSFPPTPHALEFAMPADTNCALHNVKNSLESELLKIKA